MLQMKMTETKNSKSEKDLKKLAGKTPFLELGFFETARYTNGDFVAQVAARNEFGTLTIPPRPFFRNVIDNEKVRARWSKQLALNIPRIGFKGALQIVGQEGAGELTNSINGAYGKFVENAPSTIKAKKSSQPLVYTGFMRENPTFKVSE